MNQSAKPKKLRGGKIIPALFLVCLVLAVPFVTNRLLIGEVTNVNDVYAGDGQRMGYIGGKVFVKVENRAMFHWLDRLFAGNEGAYIVSVYVKDPSAFKTGSRILALMRSRQEDSDPPGLGAFWITSVSGG